MNGSDTSCGTWLRDVPWGNGIGIFHARSPVSKDFLLYPNPAHDHLIVAVENTTSKHIGIADLSGRTVLELTPTTDQLTVIPIDRLAQGAYWVTVHQGEQRTVKKLIVQ